MATIDELERVLQTQADLAEALCAVLAEKQQAIVEFEADRLGGLTEREEELMAPFHEIERERDRLTAALDGTGSPGTHVSLRDVLARMGNEGSDGLRTHADRLRTAVQRLVRMNDQNRVLLQQGLRFVRESLRIVTDNNQRRLVDHKA
jgi:flagellar biosynthesis/type III secretory pathway chaperone